LIRTLADCRRQVAELEASNAHLKQAEEKERLFQILLGAVDDVVWATSADGETVLYMNDASERIYGRPSSEFLGDPDLWLDVVHPEDRERVAAAWERLLEEGSIEIDYRILRPDGEARWIRDRKYVAYDETGDPIRIGSITSDVTDRKATQEALVRSEEKARRLSQAAFEGIVLHEGGEIVETNQVFADLLGYEPSDLVGMDGLELVAPEYRDLVAERIASGYQKPYEAVMVRKDGTELPVEFLGRTMAYQGGPLRVTAVRDIRDRKRREETIRRQAEEILEISTPTLRVWDGVLVVPLIGTLDSERSQRFVDALLNAIVASDSEIALVDITGVPTIDTQTAHHLIETISAVRLLGAEVILTGVRPSIAQTLVHLGIDLSGIATYASLAVGLRVALERIEAAL
jgi:PAS domain S-box-containing protein